MPFLYSVFQLSCPDGAYSISPGTDLIAKGMEDALSKGINHIFLEPGIHILTKHVTISEEVIFSGAGRGSTFVHGLGFKIKGKNDKRCTFLDFTVHMTKGIGLEGQSGMSFDCLRMHFDQCGGTAGVFADRTDGRLINCQITHCVSSAVFNKNGSTIEIEGDETMIENNNTKGYNNHYGLTAYHASSRIYILSPLTKELISKNNQNGNCGGQGTIQTVQSFGAPTSPEGETKEELPSPVRIVLLLFLNDVVVVSCFFSFCIYSYVVTSFCFLFFFYSVVLSRRCVFNFTRNRFNCKRHV